MLIRDSVQLIFILSMATGNGKSLTVRQSNRTQGTESREKKFLKNSFKS